MSKKWRVSYMNFSANSLTVSYYFSVLPFSKAAKKYSSLKFSAIEVASMTDLNVSLLNTF